MRPVILDVPGNRRAASALSERIGAERGACTVRQFPDGEYYVRIETPAAEREVIVVCSLARPSEKILPLLFLADTARELGATRVGLVAPYLAFMRQDKRFRAGEGVTSRYFAALLSRAFDWLVTVDPHLHRWSSLDEIYAIPSRVVHAAPAIAAWIRANIDAPVLIGPDAESEQWVAAVAARVDAPHLILEKTRRGDRDVEVTEPDLSRCRGRTPVLVDDIISTARTMIEPVTFLREAGQAAPVCIGVHAIFADHAYDDLMAAGAARVVTCDTVTHPSNAISIDDALADAVGRLLMDDTAARSA